MGKIVMPKNSALLNEIEAVLKIYYEEGSWLSNEIYKSKLKALIGDDQYTSSYTKKAQITSYFGFTEWEDIHKSQSLRRITEAGKKMYEAIVANDSEEIQAVLMTALETVTFGRNNYGCPDSNSDVEPPALFIRACLDLGYLTYREFAFLLWKLEDVGGNYTDSISELKAIRTTGQLDLNDEAKKYQDAKAIMILVRWGFLKEQEVSSGGKHIIVDPAVESKYASRLRNLKIYNVDKNILGECVSDDEVTGSTKASIGENYLYYGVPGAGKSHAVDKIVKGQHAKRVVFHPEYTYADFVGQVLPKSIWNPETEKYEVSYPFMPGPFTDILRDAINDKSNQHYWLIIEEINRGNAPAIFGDIFQLLDREKDGTSKYGITNADIARIVYKEEELDEDELSKREIKLPGNLSIIATMNTSDQNVFTLDTAFQRRWKMKMIKNDFDSNDDGPLMDMNVSGTGVAWRVFGTVINKAILDANDSMLSTADKQLGTHFVDKEDLAEENRQAFAEKVIKYLWDDAVQLNRSKVFAGNPKDLSVVIEQYTNKSGRDRLTVFAEGIMDEMIERMKKSDTHEVGIVDQAPMDNQNSEFERDLEETED